MNKKSTLALAGLFTATAVAVGTVAVAKPLKASVTSARATPQDDFHNTVIISTSACDTQYRGAAIRLVGQNSESDFIALKHAAFPKEMWDMNNEEISDYLDTLPKDQADKIMADYFAIAGPFWDAYEDEPVGAFDKVMYVATDSNTGLFDRQKAISAFTPAFQDAANIIEDAGVSMRFTITISNDPSLEKECQARKNTPAPRP